MSHPKSNRSRIVIGSVAGHHFGKNGELTVTRHCQAKGRLGYYHVRRWLADRKAFAYDPSLGWAYERWFSWIK